MDNQELKLELIQWISDLKSNRTLKEVLKLKSMEKITTTNEKRGLYGCAKGLIVHMAEDFDEPLADFKEYM